MIRPALRIAERNLGENHLGTLAGKGQLARIIAHAGPFQETESMRKEVIKATCTRLQNDTENIQTASRQCGLCCIIIRLEVKSKLHSNCWIR